VCIVTETWIKEGRNDEVAADVDTSKYFWFSRERTEQKSKSGDGGVGILIKRDLGAVSVARASKDYDTLWVELEKNDSRLYLAAVYIGPEGSSRDNDGERQLLDLEADIAHFRKKGKVILLGDFNARIGQKESRVIRNAFCFLLSFVSQKRFDRTQSCDR
jgi:endonuclease/exonuclease/phosphatase family metal-dependent hydrolase